MAENKTDNFNAKLQNFYDTSKYMALKA